VSRKNREIEVMARGVFVCRGHLLVCRTGKADMTYLPGGHVEFGESVPVALVREVREELGCRARVTRFLGVVEHPYVQKGEPHCEINLVFEMRVNGLDPRRPVRSVEGHLSFSWIPLSRLGRSDLEPAVLRRLLPVWLRAGRSACTWGSTFLHMRDSR
jgi:8-oxo-dGTP pyrophosphatase MutT (NUDIX family)